jgi:hydroxymethylbilane synthase
MTPEHSDAFPATPRTLVIASRRSRLALQQAEAVCSALQALYPDTQITVLGLATRGDQLLDRALSESGGKGLFVQALETALADGRADLAVHSLKDMPVDIPAEFNLAAIPERADARDAFVSVAFPALNALPPGSRIGTASLRRAALLRARAPQVDVRLLRGNLDTRLRKLDAGEYEAIIIAAAGLQRLNLEQRIRCILAPETWLPAAGQGALGIEICTHRRDVAHWLAPLHHTKTACAVESERAVLRLLGGSCAVPIAAFANWQDSQLYLRAAVMQPDGSRVFFAQARAAVTTRANAIALGIKVADDLIHQGAHEIVRALSAT